MSLITATGIALILSTLIYHGGLAYLFARAQFGDVLDLPRREKLLIIAKHPDAYRQDARRGESDVSGSTPLGYLRGADVVDTDWYPVPAVTAKDLPAVMVCSWSPSVLWQVVASPG